jgi:hypothetical protein
MKIKCLYKDIKVCLYKDIKVCLYKDIKVFRYLANTHWWWWFYKGIYDLGKGSYILYYLILELFFKSKSLIQSHNKIFSSLSKTASCFDSTTDTSPRLPNIRQHHYFSSACHCVVETADSIRLSEPRCLVNNAMDSVLYKDLYHMSRKSGHLGHFSMNHKIYKLSITKPMSL